MQARVQHMFVGWAFMAILLTSVDASACQPLEAKPLQQLLDEVIGVVRAKVMGADVRNVEELGVTCDAVICDILEVRLNILEVFKGSSENYSNIYAPIPMMCSVMILPGWEYVLFLHEHEGLILPNNYSFSPQGERGMPRVVELRQLTAK